MIMEFLVESTDWIYNDEQLAGISIPADTCDDSGAFYSYGISRAYNGDGYSTYYTYRSPKVNN